MKAREPYGFDYLGDEDNDRISSAPLSEEEIFEQVRKIVNGVEEKPATLGELSASTHPLEVYILFHQYTGTFPIPVRTAFCH